MIKKDEPQNPVQGSGSDNEKSPVVAPAKVDGGEPMEEVEQTKRESSKQNGPEVDAAEEDFVVVEGGGEADSMAQEKVVEEKKVEEKDGMVEQAPPSTVVVTGGKDEVAEPVAELVAEVKGITPPTFPRLVCETNLWGV